MAVWAHEHAAGLVEDDLAVGRHAGPHALAEEDHVLRVQAEVAVVLEVRDRGVVVRLARHHVERDADRVLDGGRENLARMEVEEGRARDGADGVGALGTVEAEARALAARDEQHADMSGREFLLARRDGLLQRRALELGHLRRRGLALLRGRGDFAGENLLATRDFLEVDLLDLRQQGLPLGRGELLPEAQELLLPVLLQ